MTIILIALLGVAALWLQGKLYGDYWNKNLEVTLHFRERSMQAGQTGHLEEIIENDKLLPIPALKVKFKAPGVMNFLGEKQLPVTDQLYYNDIFSIGSHRRITRSLEFTCKSRSYLVISGMNLVGSDLFFSKELYGEADGQTEMYVFPKKLQNKDIRELLVRVNGEMQTARFMQQDQFSYIGIREYTSQDEMKDINWKASAKQDSLMVNMHGYTTRETLYIYVNLDDRKVLRQEELLEYSISLAGTLAQELIGQGGTAGVYTNAQDILEDKRIEVRPGGGNGYEQEIWKQLTRIDYHKEVADFQEILPIADEKNLSGSLLLVISSDWHEDLQEALSQLKEKGGRLLWICPIRKDTEPKIRPELQESVMFPVYRPEEQET